MFFTSCAPISANCTESLLATCSCTARETQMPPTSAMPSSRAAILTPSPSKSPSRSTTSPIVMTMRKLMWRLGEVAGAGAFLDVDRAPQGFDRAGEFSQHGVARGVEDSAAITADEIVG